MNLTVKTPQNTINLDRKEKETLILCIRHFKDNAYRHKIKTGEDDYSIMACKLLTKNNNIWNVNTALAFYLKLIKYSMKLEEFYIL